MSLGLLENNFIINRVMMLVKSKNRLIVNGIENLVFYCCFALSAIQLISGTPPAENVDFTSDEVKALEKFIREVLRSSKRFASMNFDMKQRDELTLQTFSNAFRVDRAEEKEEFFTALHKIKKERWRCWSLHTFNIVQSVTRAPHKKRYTKAVAEQLKKGGIVEELIYTTKKFARIIDVIRHMPEEEELMQTIRYNFGIELTLFFVDAEFGDHEQWKMAVQHVYALAKIGVTHHQLGELIEFCERKQEKGKLTLEQLEEKLTLLRRIWQLPLMQLHLIPEKRRRRMLLESDKRKEEERKGKELNKRRQLLFRLMLPLIPADVEKVFKAINRNYGLDRDIDIYNVCRNSVIYNLLY